MVKILSRELDNMKGRVKYYAAEYSLAGGDGGGGAGDCDDLYEEIDRLNDIIDYLQGQLPCPVYRTWCDFSNQTWGGPIS